MQNASRVGGGAGGRGGERRAPASPRAGPPAVRPERGVGGACYSAGVDLRHPHLGTGSFPVDGPFAACNASGAAGPGWGRPLSFSLHGRAMADNIPMTRAGAEAIKRELKRLKSVERPRNVHDISVARDHGDLRENAEYHAAKERQSHIEGRIQMLEDRLARAQIIDVSKLSGDRVVFGATVKLEDVDSGQQVQYTIA